MADWSDIEHHVGDLDYIANLNTHIDRTEAIATEVENGRDGEATLIASLNTRMKKTVMDVNLSGANTYKLVNMIDPTSSQDYTTKSWVLSQITIGGDPSGISITSLAVGTATANQFICANSGATAVEGRNASAYNVTSFGLGALLANQILKVDSAGTGWEGMTFPLQTGKPDYVLTTDGSYLSWKRERAKRYFFGSL